MAKFSTEDFPDSDGRRLEVNYRSSEEIVTAYSTFAQKMTASTNNASLKADRGPNGKPIELRLVSDKEAMSVAIAGAITERHSDGTAYLDQAVLCTGNEKLGELARALERLRIPVLFLGSLFERSEIKDLLSLLSLLADRRAMGLVRVGCMRDFVLTLGDVSAILDLLREEPKEPLSWLKARSSLPISEEAPRLRLIGWPTHSRALMQIRHRGTY